MSARKTSQEKRREYEELGAYVERFFFHVLKSPIRVDRFDSEEWKEAEIEYHGLSELLAGVKEAVNDTVQMSVDMTADQVRRLDAALKADGVLTLSEVRVRYWRRYKSIVKRGRIRSDLEFRMVVGILADVEASIPKEERALLEKLAHEYEQRV